MINKLRIGWGSDPVWAKTMSVSLGLFFVFFSDAILSYWVPNFLEKNLGGALVMGLVMAFSSIVGFGADLVFPELLKGTTVRRLIVMAIVASLMFTGVLLAATWWPVLAILLIAMGIWGVYYEFLGFASQQFVAESVPAPDRSRVWAVLMTFKSLAYVLGPVVAGFLVRVGDRQLLLATAVATLLGYGVFTWMKLKDHPVSVETEEINVVKELAHWRVLFVHVWPVILISLMLGLADAAFWTTGTVWSETLAQRSWWGGLFVSAYMLPSMFMGFVIVKWGIYQHKKKWAEMFLLLGGLLLALLGVSEVIAWQLGVVIAASVMMSLAYPLTDAVYSDIAARMGRERKHLIGLSNSTVSLAYIVGPILAGALAQAVGERGSFVVTGGLMAVMGGVLLLVTPKKLKLPQTEIQAWEEEHSHENP